MDYEVFLLSRIRERYDVTGDNTAAVASGLQRTGGVITSAALLLAIVVGAFSASGISFIKLLGVGMIVALIVDATIVRVLLVPATMRLAGRANWYAPRPLRRLHGQYVSRQRRPGRHRAAGGHRRARGRHRADRGPAGRRRRPQARLPESAGQPGLEPALEWLPAWREAVADEPVGAGVQPGGDKGWVAPVQGSEQLAQVAGSQLGGFALFTRPGHDGPAGWPVGWRDRPPAFIVVHYDPPAGCAGAVGQPHRASARPASRDGAHHRP
jgi:hypothetical protein